MLPLLANRGFTVTTGVRLYTLADVFAYAQTEGITLRLDGTEIRVRRPPVHKAGRNRFVSGKARANTIKTTVITDEHARPLWAGATVPGRMHDQAAINTPGSQTCLTSTHRYAFWPTTDIGAWVTAIRNK